MAYEGRKEAKQWNSNLLTPNPISIFREKICWRAEWSERREERRQAGRLPWYPNEKKNSENEESYIENSANNFLCMTIMKSIERFWLSNDNINDNYERRRNNEEEKEEKQLKERKWKRQWKKHVSAWRSNSHLYIEREKAAAAWLLYFHGSCENNGMAAGRQGRRRNKSQRQNRHVVAWQRLSGRRRVCLYV